MSKQEPRNSDAPPLISSRREVFVSPWMTVLEKSVAFPHSPGEDLYYSVKVSDYITVQPILPDGRLAVVKQFRPAIEQFTYELPAGLLDADEDAESAARRELLEETGLRVLSMHYLGAYQSDTGRISNVLHSFFARTTAPDPNFVPEPGVSVEFWTKAELHARILDGSFRHQLHLGVLYASLIRPEAQW